MAERFHQLILFRGPGFSGEHKHIFRSTSLAGDPWMGAAASFAVTDGAWQLFKDGNFTSAVGSTFCPRPRGYPSIADFDVPSTGIGSLRLVDDDRRRIPHLVLFDAPSFRGHHRHVFDSLPDAVDWKDAASAVVFCGRWQLVGNNMPPVDLAVGVFADLAGLGMPQGALSSVALVDPAPAATFDQGHLIAFENAIFGGGHRHVFADIPSLDGGWSKTISSFVVEFGGWTMFVADAFTQPQGTVFTRGRFAWIEDLEVDNDSVQSIRSVPVPAGPAPLVTGAGTDPSPQLLTAQATNCRLGWNPHETKLNPRNVRQPSFGRLWKTVLGARVYGQPLVAPNGGRNLILVATARNDVVALDSESGAIVWKTNLGEPVNDDAFSAPLTDPCRNTSPWHGVNSTPVVDPSGTTIYVAYLAKINDHANFDQGYFLQALNVADGSLGWDKPVPIRGTFPRDGQPPLSFLPYMHTQRAALTYTDAGFGGAGTARVLIPFSSRCDVLSKTGDDWQGWIFVVDVSQKPPPPPSAFADAQVKVQNDGCGGIWGHVGVALDDDGRLYAVTGNGLWNGSTNFANSVIQLGSSPLRVLSYYTPKNYEYLWHNDRDLGGSSAIVLPLQTLRAVPGPGGDVGLNVLVTGGKDGRAYFLSAAPQLSGLGGALWRPKLYKDTMAPYDGGITISPAYYDAGSRGRFVYFCAAGPDAPFHGLVAVKLDDLDGETMLGARIIQFEGEPLTGAPGTPFVSSNGADDGIVWAVDSFRQQNDDGADSVLRAWDACSGQLLYSSPRTADETVGDGRKFAAVAVVGGRVFVPADGVVCYGLRE